MNKFISSVMRTYAENAEDNIRIRAHFPKSHHGLPTHGQFSIIDNSKGEKGECVSKFRMYK